MLKNVGSSISMGVLITLAIITPVIIASPFFFTEFMCRYYCSGKRTWLMIASITGNVGIMVAYFGIPFAIWRATNILNNIKLKGGALPGLFILFILLCGITHGLQALAWFHAYYYLMGYVEIWTALFSLFTLFKITEYIIKSFAQQELENKKLHEDNVYMKDLLIKHGIKLDLSNVN